MTAPSPDVARQAQAFRLWSDTRPENPQKGQLLLWRTRHVQLGVRMTMSGQLRSMHDGWKNTDHILPPMTRWDGYRHLIPAGLEWSAAVPNWILEEATWTGKDRWGHEQTSVIERKLVQLLEVEGSPLETCPFCGKPARWDSRDGFIGAMPHQDGQFSSGHCLRTGFFHKPSDAAAFWNRRAYAATQTGAS